MVHFNGIFVDVKSVSYTHLYGFSFLTLFLIFIASAHLKIFVSLSLKEPKLASISRLWKPLGMAVEYFGYYV